MSKKTRAIVVQTIPTPAPGMGSTTVEVARPEGGDPKGWNTINHGVFHSPGQITVVTTYMKKEPSVSYGPDGTDENPGDDDDENEENDAV